MQSSPNFDFTERYERQRLLAWPYIESFFHNLPPSLTDMGWQFAQRLARQTAPSGHFKDALKHPATARVAYLPLWHIEAYVQQGVSIQNVEVLQAHLFASAFLGFAAIRIHDDLIDGDNVDTPINELQLANLLIFAATRHLHQLFGSDSPLWEHHARHWNEFTHAVQVDIERNRAGLAHFDDQALLLIGRKAALLKTYPVAVAQYTGREDQIAEFEAIMDSFNTAIQINNDIQSINRDLAMGHYTHPLVAAATAAGYGLGTHPPQDALLHSMIISTALVASHRKANAYYKIALQQSRELAIDDLTAFIEWHIEDLAQSEERWSALQEDADRVPVSFLNVLGKTVAVGDEPLSALRRCVNMALQFLLFDPKLRESWEVQRTGVWDQELLIGDVFSRALITDVLAQYGKISADQVESVLGQYQANGWRYYRDFKRLPPDIDDIAQTIRLLKHVGWDEMTKRAYLEAPLRWLEANRAQDGGFPVWLTEDIEDRPAEGWIHLGGTRCLACEANLIDALADWNTAATNTWLPQAMTSLLDRWENQGYNGVYYYKPAYGASVIARCLANKNLLAGLQQGLVDRMELLLRTLAQEQRATAVADPVSLAASLQIMARVSDVAVDIIHQRRELLLGCQSFDGGWGTFELFRCPGTPHRAMGWHGGRLLTTAHILTAIDLTNKNR